MDKSVAHDDHDSVPRVAVVDLRGLEDSQQENSPSHVRWAETVRWLTLLGIGCLISALVVSYLLHRSNVGQKPKRTQESSTVSESQDERAARVRKCKLDAAVEKMKGYSTAPVPISDQDFELLRKSCASS